MAQCTLRMHARKSEWVLGSVLAWASQLQSDALARPIWETPERPAVRLTLRTEALAKLVCGFVAAAARGQVDAAVGEHLCVAWRSGGANADIMDTRATA